MAFRFNRRDFLKLGLSIPLIPPARGAVRAPRQRPNVVFVLTDDQGYGDLACHGNPSIRTPAIDRMHAESVRFTRFFASPTCSPTRTALLTGRHEFHSGVTHTTLSRNIPAIGEPVLPEILRSAEYRTALFGKWHLGDNYPFRPMDRGFEKCLYHGGGGMVQTPDWFGNAYTDPVLNHDGTWKPTRGYCTDVYFRAAMDWISEHRNEPFFCMITPNAPHEPLQVPDGWTKSYLAMGLTPDASKFYAMIENIDQNMGRLFQHLNRLGIEKNTLVIFMTDNGSAQACRLNLYNAGMRTCKGSPYEGGVRVPCFFRWKGSLAEGVDIGQSAAHVDILPTLAELCGAPPPATRAMDGRSLVPLLSNPHAPWGDRYLVTHVGRWPIDAGPQKDGPWSVRYRQYRLVHGKELFDLEQDPGESRNMIEQRPEIAGAIQKAYDAWWEDVLPAAGRIQRIQLGSDRENPSRLDCMDWRPSRILPDQPDLRQFPFSSQERLLAMVSGETVLLQGKPMPDGATGSWAVAFDRPGRYAFTLRKFPSHAPDKIKRLKTGEAHLWAGPVRLSKPIPEGADAVRFEAVVEAGPADLEGWFTGQRKTDAPLGAFFVDVERISA